MYPNFYRAQETEAPHAHHSIAALCGDGLTLSKVYAGLKDRMMAPETLAEAMRAYAEETNRLNRERRANGEDYLELAKIQRTLKQMLGVIEEGGHTRGMTDRMRELEAREDVLKELLAQEPAGVPDIHPNVSGICRKKVERLAKSLNNPEERYEEAEAIRALVEKITLRPGPNRGEIDATLHGELGTILGWIDAQALAKTQKRETPAASATGVSVSVVAGRAVRFLRLIEGPVPKVAA